MVTRSETSRQAILAAALHLLGARDGHGLTLEQLTMEAIASRAGVSKATIYRWWPSKSAVVLDAFIEDHISHTAPGDDLNAVAALRSHVRTVVRQYAGPVGRIVAQLVAAGQYDDEALNAFRDRFWSGRNQVVRTIILRGIDGGLIRGDIEPDVAAALLYSPIYHRLLLGTGPLDDDFAEQVFDGAMRGLAPSSAPVAQGSGG